MRHDQRFWFKNERREGPTYVNAEANYFLLLCRVIARHQNISSLGGTQFHHSKDQMNLSSSKKSTKCRPSLIQPSLLSIWSTLWLGFYAVFCDCNLCSFFQCAFYELTNAPLLTVMQTPMQAEVNTMKYNLRYEKSGWKLGPEVLHIKWVLE